MERLTIPSYINQPIRRGFCVATTFLALGIAACGPTYSPQPTPTPTQKISSCNYADGVTLYTRPNFQGDCINFPKEGTYVLDEYNNLYPHVESLRDPRHCHIEFRDKGNRPSYYDTDTPILAAQDVDQEYTLKFESCK